jgi:DNA uptake protein ComE-like DNA-binding protein
MKHKLITTTLITASLLLGNSWAVSATTKTIKLVDINSATAKELATLPGITAEDAAKIVAGRPYGSKAWLVTHNAIPEAKYHPISAMVVAKQPFKEASKNLEALKKAQKPASQ